MQNKFIFKSKNGILNNRVVKFQADVSVTDNFIAQNEKIWIPSKKAEAESYCYIDSWHPRELASIIPQLVFAHGLANSNSIKTLVLSPPVDKPWKNFYKSFGVRQAVIRKRIIDKAYGLLKALQLTMKGERGADLLQVCYKGIPIGETLYDTIIRTTKDQYTIERVSFKNFKRIYDFFSTVSCVYNIFMLRKPEFYMPFERCHLQGALAIIASHFGAKLIQCTANGRIIYLGEGPEAKVRWQDLQKKVLEEYLKREITEDYVEIVDNYLKERFMGKGNFDVIRAFMNKTIITRSEFADENDLDKNKKNIVIMSHVFSDEPHGSEFLLYQDYYVWYKETLKIIQNIKNVNWIVKAHPSRELYGEGEEVYNVFMKYKQSNMAWFPDEYSTASLSEIADAIVTVQGSAGREFSCLGKPVVLCGRAFYSGFGFTVEPKTIEEYEQILMNLDKVQPLGKEERKNACKLMYAFLKTTYKPYDDFDEMLVDSYQKEVKDGNNMVLENLYQNIRKCDDYYVNTRFYQEGKKMGEKVEQLPVGTMVIHE